MRKHGGVAFGPDAGELLRARGLRVTPQRRAILGAFSHGAAEHLSADEIHARAAAVVPELGRGTVYAALAELTELGLLAARGSPEPVRYETNTEPHQHFRCRLCLRLFDVALADPARGARRASSSSRSRSPRRASARSASPTTRACARGRSGRAAVRRADLPRGAGRDDRRHAGRPAHARRDGRRRDARRSSKATATCPRCSRRSTAAAGAGPPASTSPPRRTRSRRTSPARPAARARSTGRGCRGAHDLRAAMAVPRAQLASYDALDIDGRRARARPHAGRQPARDPHPLPPRDARPRDARRLRGRRRAAARARRARARLTAPQAAAAVWARGGVGQPRGGLAQQPRDVHLRQAEPLGRSRTG